MKERTTITRITGFELRRSHQTQEIAMGKARLVKSKLITSCSVGKEPERKNTPRKTDNKVKRRHKENEKEP